MAARKRPSRQHRRNERSGNPARRAQGNRPNPFERPGTQPSGHHIDHGPAGFGGVEPGGPIEEDQPPVMDDLLGDLLDALDDDHPLTFLDAASMMTRVLAPRDASGLEAMMARSDTEDEGPELPELSEMLAMFAGSGQPPTEALAYAISRLGSTEANRARVDRELGASVQRLPGWLRQLDRAEPTEALLGMDPMRAGANVAVGVRLVDGQQLTVVGFIDFDLGSVLTDAFVMDRSPQEYAEIWQEISQGQSDQQPLSLADARARLEAGIRFGDMTVPPYETDQWPQCRAIVEWVLRMLPSGGHEFAGIEVTDADREAILDDFVASPEAEPLRSDPDTRAVADSLLNFRNEYNDPLMWSAKRVEIFLTHYAARKIIAERDFMIKFPQVLSAFIRYGHRRRGVSSEMTRDAAAAVDTATPEYQQLLGQHGSGTGMLGSGAEALLGLLGADSPDEVDWDNVDLESVLAGADRSAHQAAGNDLLRDAVIGNLELKAGGPEALRSLDDQRLPDEPLNLDGIDTRVVDAVAECGAHVDAACAALFEPEARTAARRLLHDVAVADPGIFRRGRTDTAAAAICRIIMIVNNGNPIRYDTWIPMKQLWQHFGISSAAKRADAMLAALGQQPDSEGLGGVRYLTASTRQTMIDYRDRWR